MRILLGMCGAVLVPGLCAAQLVTSPDDFLGRPLGADFELADWGEVSGYWKTLAEQSPRVQVEAVGTTTGGREFLLAVVSSEENLTRLDAIRADNALLADPRGLEDAELEALVATGPATVFISLAMHSNETAAPQFGMELGHRLATSDEEPWRGVRERVVVVIAACTNPDGLDDVVAWYRATVGTPHEASSLPGLYQHYAGHDNNRDWFMQSLAETRIVTRQLYEVWRPQIYWDVHQQGSRAERMFVPPFRDPLNGNLDAGIITAIDAIGSRALHDLTAEGLTGVSTGVTYDMWWNGGNRNVPVRHNLIGLLTEAASVDLASPIFLPRSELRAPSGLDGGYRPSHRFPAPWPGGWWQLRDIIEYELAFARSLLGSAAREPALWRRAVAQAAATTVALGREQPPRAWIVPADARDPDAVLRLAEALSIGAVELHVAAGDVQADGRAFPAGSLVIRADQPAGRFVKDLFERQEYPAGDPPYDVAGWSLPALLGVPVVGCVEAPTGTLVPAADARQATAGMQRWPSAAQLADGRLDGGASGAWRLVIERLAAGETLQWIAAGESPGRFGRAAAADGQTPGGRSPVDGSRRVAGLPRIGVHAPWSADMDEGWLRWVFDRWRLPYRSVRDAELRAGALTERFDVLVFAGGSARELDAGRASGSVPSDLAGGLGAEGRAAVAEFVRAGGTLVALQDSAAWAAELLALPIVDVTRAEEGRGFACPGSVVRLHPRASEFTAGLPDVHHAFFAGSRAWRVEPREGAPAVASLLDYAESELLWSGWVAKPEVVHGRAAWLRASVGEGAVHLFGFRPQYRSWSQASFGLLFRAILLEPR